MTKVDKDGEISSKEVEISDTCRVRMVVKSANGKLYLDVRKWFKYPNQDEFLPSKKGLMLDFSEWKQVIKDMDEFLKAEYQEAA
jgi:hypothetical protein